MMNAIFVKRWGYSGYIGIETIESVIPLRSIHVFCFMKTLFMEI